MKKDKEYKTQDIKEVAFLKSKGIRYNYVYIFREDNIKEFKYTKNAELFKALYEYYR